MILYHIGHFGALSKALLIHLTYHKNDKCVIIIDQIIFNDEGKAFIKNFSIRAKDFAKVITYSDIEFINEKSVISTEKHIKLFFDKMFSDYSIRLSEFKKIYSMFDTYNAFAAYVQMNNIPIIFIDAFGNLEKNRYYLNNKEQWQFYDEVIYKYRALGFDNPNCRIIYSTRENDSDKLNFENLKNLLSEEEKKKLLFLYGYESDTKTPEYCNLLVFSSGWICSEKKINKANYFYYYQLLLDLFCDNTRKILLKPHPNTSISKEEALNFFDNAEIIPGYFPSEFIDLLPNYEITNILSTSSSGIPRHIYGCNYFISFDIFYNDILCKKLYFALQIEKYLQPLYNKYFHIGLHNKLIWGMQENLFSKYDLKSKWVNLNNLEPNSITIIDNYEWNGVDDKYKLTKAMASLNNNAVLIFLDSKDTDNYIFSDYPSFRDWFISLKFCNKPNNMNIPVRTEKIHIFCKDISILNFLKCLNYNEYFHYTKEFLQLIK